MRLTIPIIVLAASVAAIISAGCGKKRDGGPATKDTLLVYLMAGQSNMAGRGLIEPQDTTTDPRILTIDSAGQLVIAREPLHFYHPGFSGLDCGVSFARTLLTSLPEGKRICLVPCAMSSTSIEDWLGDSLHGVKLYTNMMSRAELAMQRGVLHGVLWHQGESNAENGLRAQYYSENLSAFIYKIRSDVGNDQLPFFAATLAAFCPRPFKDSVNSAIRRTAAQVPRVYVIPTDDLSCKSDGVHFDSPGQREMGRRFAVAAAAVIP